MNPAIASFLRLAHDDLSATKLLLKDHATIAAYHIEQAAEKLIKAVLTRENIRARTRHHRLTELVALLPRDHRWRIEVEKLTWLEAAAMRFRCPEADGFVADLPDPTDYANAIMEIEALYPAIEAWCQTKG